MKSKLAENLIKIRKKKGLSQEQLAKMAGLARGTVAYYENEETAKSHVENIYAIAKVLNIRIEDLINSSSDKEFVNQKNIQIDSRTMKKIELILSLPKRKRFLIYTMVEALANFELKETKDNS
jgi:transcriptional regulator with XRE-family HTH domain